MKKILTFIMVLLVSIMIVACAKADYSGTYNMTEMSYGGVTIKKGTDAWKQVVGDGEFMTFEFKNDGTGISKIPNSEDTEVEYKVDGENITINEKDKNQDDKMEGTIKDGKIEITQKKDDNEMKMVFEKENK